jgi:H+-transporting ATPase
MQGLSTAEAKRRLAAIGPNAVEEAKISPVIRIGRRFWEPVPWMLEAAILLQLAIGERIEALIIAALLIFNVALSLVQEGRADAALAALKSRLALKAYARRDGRWCEIAAADLVPRDIIRLSLGGVVPADARILEGAVLLDQSMLTGESMPVEIAQDKTAYAGALVRRGGATAEVTATGARTYFGRTAELVRIAHADSSEQRAMLGVVRNLAVFNGGLVVLLVAYAHSIAMPVERILPLVLTALLASIPVALPATFTLAAALAAQSLTKKGVLLTRLSTIHEAAAVDVLCSDKTGTLTRNELAVTAVRSLQQDLAESDVLALAALASAEGGQDPVDFAVRSASAGLSAGRPAPAVVRFVPFDPARKISEAVVLDRDRIEKSIVKGAPGAVAALAAAPLPSAEIASLTGQGYRVLAVATGTPGAMRLAGLIGLSDPPRSDSRELLDELRALGVGVVMVTGDAAETAAAIAHRIGLAGPVCPAGEIPARIAPERFAVYAGVFPEDKFRLVKAFQREGHVVAMCGDGANDAPALRQAQMGIAVSTATDVAKSAASLVLTEPGLAGIVLAIREGRSAYQRVLSYALNALVKKFELVLFLGIGLVMTGHAVLTPMLMALLLVTGDFITMSLTTDNAIPSSRPDAWRVGYITAAAAALGACMLAFSIGLLAVGWYRLHLGPDGIRTLAFVTLVFVSQVTVYLVRERRHMWRSRPSRWLVLSSLADIGIASTLATAGLLMAPLQPLLILCVLLAAIAFGVLVDLLKPSLFNALRIA